MDDPALRLADNLLFSVFRCCSFDWQYKSPSTSSKSQEVFDLHFGKAVVHTLCVSYVRTMSMAKHLPILSTLTKETFYLTAQLLEENIFNSADKRFLLMVHVAIYAVFFLNSGKMQAGTWAFDIMYQHAAQCNLRNQVYYSM